MEIGYEQIQLNAGLPAQIAYLDTAQLGPFEMINEVPPHWHRSLEISLVDKGEVELWVHDEKQVLHPGDFILVNSGAVHQLKADPRTDTAVLLVIISYEFLKKVYPAYDEVAFVLEKDCPCLNDLRQIYAVLRDYCQHPKALDELRVQACLYELVYCLLHYCQMAKYANPTFK